MFDDVLEPLLVSDLVIEAVLDVWKQRKRQAQGIVLADDRLVRGGIVPLAYPAVGLLDRIEVVDLGTWVELLVAVDEEQRFEAAVEQADGIVLACMQEPLRKGGVLLVLFRVLRDLHPGPVIHVDKILVIEMDAGYKISYQSKTPQKSVKNRNFPPIISVYTINQNRQDVKLFL